MAAQVMAAAAAGDYDDGRNSKAPKSAGTTPGQWGGCSSSFPTPYCVCMHPLSPGYQCLELVVVDSVQLGKETGRHLRSLSTAGPCPCT